jgi:basic membrane protein A
MPPFGMTRRQAALGATAAATLAGIGRARAQEPLKIGYVYVGAIGDFGWTYAHDVGRKAVEEKLGDKVATSFVESVSEGPDSERVIRQLAASGHGLVYTTSFGFMNPTARVAKQFSRVKFEHCTGYTRGPNLATYAARFYEGRTVLGTLAGMLTKTGRIGYIGSFPIPEVVQGINAFTIAMHKHKPDATVRVIWVNSWFDPGKEADAAKALFDLGCDIVTQHTDSAAPMQVAEERGLMAFGQDSDMRQFGPNAQLTAIVNNWADYYIERAQAALDGTWTAGDTWGGIASGMVQIPPYGPKVTPEAAARADEIKSAILVGALHPFAGPIKDASGTERVAAGQHLADPDILKMDWYVPGVQV